MTIGRRRTAVITLSLLALPGILAGCGRETEGDGSGEAADTAGAGERGTRPAGSGAGGPPAARPPAEASPLRGVLPGLFGIMVGLQDDMARLDRGIWIESYDSIAVAARAVADHPTVPPEEFQRISGVLGDEMASFGGMDVNVHDLAVELEGHARAGRLGEVLRTGAELRQGCVACHSAYRERLREELGGPASQ